MMAETENALSFEKMISRIEEIVKALEKGDVSLDESLSLYTEGAELVHRCSEKLDSAEQIVVKLRKGPEGVPEELPFYPDEE